jgi:hypothetical protein
MHRRGLEGQFSLFIVHFTAFVHQTHGSVMQETKFHFTVFVYQTHGSTIGE